MTDSRLLARNAALNLAGQAAPMVAALVSIPWLIRGLGADRFGVLMLAWAVIGYFGLCDLGLGRALTHAVATRLGSEQEGELEAIGWTALMAMFALGVVGALVLIVATPALVTHVLEIPPSLAAESERAFYLLALSLPMVVSTAGLRGILEAHQHFGVATALRAPLSVLMYVVPLAMLPFTNRVDATIIALVLARVAAWVAHLAVCVRRYWFLRRGMSVRRCVALPLLRVGGWMTVSNVVSPLMTYLDRFLIAALLPMAAVAYYTIPFEAVMRLLIIPAAFVGVLFPAFAQSFGRARERTATLYDQGARAVVVVLFPASLVLITLAPEILRVWVGAEVARAASPVLQWLAAGVVVNAVGFVGFTALQGVGRADLTGKVNLLELPLYLAFIVVLARTVGLAGVAIAWTLRVTVDTSSLWILSRRHVGFDRHEVHAPLATWGVMAGALVAGALLQTTAARLAFALTALAVYLPIAWFRLIRAGEREAVMQLIRRAVAFAPATESEASGYTRLT
jgi:O-antigen/teichoic acid export membrane protein